MYPPTKTIEWWSIQNTGWSNGVSWFDSGESRYSTKEDALAHFAFAKQQLPDDDTKWRCVHTVLERFPNKDVTTKVWEDL